MYISNKMEVEIMKTPQQLAEKERVRAEKKVKEREADLEARLEIALASCQINSKGGEFALSGFNKMDLPIIEKYLARYGWCCQYSPYEDSSWSMTTRSDCYYMVHRFYVRPLEN